ncbi:flagellar hook-length control protein FliK [Sulfuricurvum sp.]|uniref:flagellar hook-length control protein FliK n=1 Tax=Sulfuricurvum sp. TaxID=2025608 RepID=UPI00262E0918|nr:flagellar hook-length control protein FliK [Sulfuricurvum sp.]MDD2781838.1 flagellar hook-length control protein FliK [Sulfuricurvum sp.]
MIIQSKETKSQASLIDLLGGNNKTSNTKSNDLFSKLLSTFGKQATADEAKVVKSTDFKTIIDPKNTSLKSTDTKNSALKELQALLGGEEKESSLVSKELLGAFTDDQVRTLIHKAKDYLKNEITQKAPEYQKDIAALPKTLMGLVQLAQKLGLEPESIHLSTLITDPEEKASFSTELLSKPLLEAKVLASLPATAAEKTPFEAITQLLSDIKGKEQKSTKTSSTESTQKEGAEKSETGSLKALLQSVDARPKESGAEATGVLTETLKRNDEKVLSLATPEKTKGETLISLLQGSQDSAEGEGEKSNVLKVETEGSKNLQPLKADSLEVKSKEAQQSMRLFASDLKEAVQEYKPPFTRLTMKLNPEKLGEVEVTLIQRGNNVHVNIQSNNTTSVAFLAHNATELKAQLAAQGITNATMNFMSGGENQQQSNAQHQQHQQEQRQNVFKSYESFEELTLNEEQLSALEIIIPHYA